MLRRHTAREARATAARITLTGDAHRAGEAKPSNEGLNHGIGQMRSSFIHALTLASVAVLTVHPAASQSNMSGAPCNPTVVGALKSEPDPRAQAVRESRARIDCFRSVARSRPSSFATANEAIDLISSRCNANTLYHLAEDTAFQESVTLLLAPAGDIVRRLENRFQ